MRRQLYGQSQKSLKLIASGMASIPWPASSKASVQPYSTLDRCRGISLAWARSVAHFVSRLASSISAERKGFLRMSPECEARTHGHKQSKAGTWRALTEAHYIEHLSKRSVIWLIRRTGIPLPKDIRPCLFDLIL